MESSVAKCGGGQHEKGSARIVRATCKGYMRIVRRIVRAT
jgi:hypothetical protein